MSLLTNIGKVLVAFQALLFIEEGTTWLLWCSPITFPLSLNVMMDTSTLFFEAERLVSFGIGKFPLLDTRIHAEKFAGSL
jgi:hypothetical protein